MDLTVGLAVAVLSVVPLLPTLGAGFLADDWFFAEAYCHDARSLSRVAWQALTSLEGAPTTFYRPVPFLSLAVQLRWTGCEPWALHAGNLLLHGLVGAGLFLLARSAPVPRASAALAALLVAWFPRRVEAVAWLSCRPDLLAAVFSVASLLFFQVGLQKLRKGLPTPFLPPFLFSLLALWLGLFSKESTLLLPAMLVALTWHAAPAARRAATPWLIALASSVPLFLLWRRTVLGTWAGGYGAEVLAVTPGTLASAAKHLAYQGIPPLEWLETIVSHRAGSAAVAATLAAVICGIAILAWRRRADPAARIGIVWWLAAMLPVVTLPISLTTTFNDRLLYLPALGVGLLVAAALHRVRSRVGLAAAAMLCLVFGIWSTTLSLRWARAGELTSRAVSALADVVRVAPEGRIYLAAAPDSLGGAYMLRNGIREALALQGVSDAERVTLLSWYFVAPAAAERSPVTATFAPPASIDLVSEDARPQVIVGTPDSRALVEIEAPATLDRFGRRQSARLRLREPGSVWLVTPGGVERVHTP